MHDGGVSAAQALLPDGELIGGHRALHHELTEPVARADVDDARMSGVGVQGEHHPGGRQVTSDHLHDHDSEGRGERVHLLGELIRDGALGEEARAALLPAQQHLLEPVDVEVALALACEARVRRVLDRGRGPDRHVDLRAVLVAEFAVGFPKGVHHVLGDGGLLHQLPGEGGSTVHLQLIAGVCALEGRAERLVQAVATDGGRADLGQPFGLLHLEPGVPVHGCLKEPPVRRRRGREAVGDTDAARDQLAVELAKGGSLAADEIGVVSADLGEPEEEGLVAVSHGYLADGERTGPIPSSRAKLPHINEGKP